jgi:hypothetical protein
MFVSPQHVARPQANNRSPIDVERKYFHDWFENVASPEPDEQTYSQLEEHLSSPTAPIIDNVVIPRGQVFSDWLDALSSSARGYDSEPENNTPITTAVDHIRRKSRRTKRKLLRANLAKVQVVTTQSEVQPQNSSTSAGGRETTPRNKGKGRLVQLRSSSSEEHDDAARLDQLRADALIAQRLQDELNKVHDRMGLCATTSPIAGPSTPFRKAPHLAVRTCMRNPINPCAPLRNCPLVVIYTVFSKKKKHMTCTPRN